MNIDNLHIHNGCTVAIEFAPQQQGTVIKTHVPLHGDITHDVQIEYSFNSEAKPEVMRLRDIPARFLIFVSAPV